MLSIFLHDLHIFIGVIPFFCVPVCPWFHSLHSMYAYAFHPLAYSPFSRPPPALTLLSNSSVYRHLATTIAPTRAAFPCSAALIASTIYRRLRSPMSVSQMKGR